MVTATIREGVLQLELSPLHQVLAFRSSVEIPLDTIESVQNDQENARAGPEGTRNPGTSIPFLVNAGTFNSGVKRTFWDVHNPDNAITIKIKRGMFASLDDGFDEVVVEVANPTETVETIQRLLTNSRVV